MEDICSLSYSGSSYGFVIPLLSDLRRCPSARRRLLHQLRSLARSACHVDHTAAHAGAAARLEATPSACPGVAMAYPASADQERRRGLRARPARPADARGLRRLAPARARRAGLALRARRGYPPGTWHAPGRAAHGMRHAVLCAAIPFAQITQAFLTSTLLFGGAVVLLAVVQFLVALLSRCRWRP